MLLRDLELKACVTLADIGDVHVDGVVKRAIGQQFHDGLGVRRIELLHGELLHGRFLYPDASRVTSFAQLPRNFLMNDALRIRYERAIRMPRW